MYPNTFKLLIIICKRVILFYGFKNWAIVNMIFLNILSLLRVNILLQSFLPRLSVYFLKTKKNEWSFEVKFKWDENNSPNLALGCQEELVSAQGSVVTQECKIKMMFPGTDLLHHSTQAILLGEGRRTDLNDSHDLWNCVAMIYFSEKGGWEQLMIALYISLSKFYSFG